jgi:glycosyltransferase involved in cell wall biosynthesis
MRILVLTPTFLPVVGGAELLVYEVYQRLGRRHEVRILTPHLPPALLQQQGADGDYLDSPWVLERYHDRLSFMRIRGHDLSRGAIPPFSLSAVAAVRRAIRAHRPDVLNVHYLMPTGLAAVAAQRWLGVPTVLSLTGRDVPGPGVPPIWRWWQRALIRLAADTTYISRFCQTAVQRAGPPRGEVVYGGVDIPPPVGDGTLIRRTLGIPPQEPLLFSLQRLGAEKRVDVLIRSLQACRAVTGCGTLVVGGQGPERPRLETLGRELGLGAALRFVGYIPREQLADHFEACDLFAFHSTFETFGLVVAQAMSYGRAVVSANATALPEIVGDTGVLVETGDWRAMGQAMADLLRDDPRRHALGDRGRARAAALFGWDRIAGRYETILQRAAGGEPRGH